MKKPVEIIRAVRSQPWPGAANLEVSIAICRRGGGWKSPVILDGQPVPEIDGFLDVPGRVRWRPRMLKANEGKSFQGAIVLGEGFVLHPEQARRILAKTPCGRHGAPGRRYAEVVRPYMMGEDLNQRPDQSPSRYVIDFRDWPLDRNLPGRWDDLDEDAQAEARKQGQVTVDYPGPVARDYPICFRIVLSLVKPERAKGNRAARRDRWWIFAERAPGLQAALAESTSAVAICRVTEYLVPSMSGDDLVASEACVLFPTNDPTDILILHSDIHEVWARKQSSSLETRLRYSPSDCFENFPLPHDRSRLEPLVEPFLAYRNGLCRARNIGLTDLYNLYHAENCADPEILELRRWHVRINRAVADSYNWGNLPLDYGHQQKRWGPRWTLDDTTSREIIDRLLELNKERYEAEVEAGLHDDGKSGRAKAAGGAKAGGAKRGRKPKAAAAPTEAGLTPPQFSLDLPDEFQFVPTPPDTPRRRKP